MSAPLLQVTHALYPQAAGEVELYTWEVARALGGAVLSFTPQSEAWPEAWDGMQVLCAEASEGAMAAWHRALDTVQPQAVFVQHWGALNPSLLLDLRERGIPYAVFLHDFTPLCPTQRLWHRTEERCSGPGRTGWKCAWCVAGTRRRALELPLRTILYRHRPQDWRTALLRAEALVASSRFARDFWIEQGAPPERIAVIAPRLGLVEAPLTAGGGAASGADLLAQALELAGEPDTGSVVAVPARWEQPFSRRIADAQAAGARVVATAVGGLAEQIIHGVNGFLAPPDDAGALAEALREAFEPEPTAWGGGQVAAQAEAAAHASAKALQTLLDLLRQGASEPDAAIELEHGDWLRQHGADAAPQLVAALRGTEVAEPEFERRAFATTRQRRLDLNRATAFFRGCGCRRLASIGGEAEDDVVEVFSTWELAFVASEALPDGLWFDGEAIDFSLLRRRYPQAKALVASLPDGLETMAM